MPKRHYTIFCDESVQKGRLFSNFYAGALIRSREQQAIENLLRSKKTELNLYREAKWTKITENYHEKYISFIDTYFNLIQGGRIKVRVMFTQNLFKPLGLTKAHVEEGYFILYYYLIKRGFGLEYCNPNAIDRIFLTILLDELPANKTRCDKFKVYVSNLSNDRDFRSANVNLIKENIADVKSDNHTILQGLDIILGAMQFKLNQKHLEKLEGKNKRGKRTIAKEKVYNHINKRIREIYPNFNIGSSTGCANGMIDRWGHPYRHWKFVPSEYELDENYKRPEVAYTCNQ